MEKSDAGKINIELPDDIAQGIYSNLTIISHSNSEFIVDFIRMMPGLNKPKVKSRIILTPENAKRLLGALSQNISNYEMQYGEITLDRNSEDDTFVPPVASFGKGDA